MAQVELVGEASLCTFANARLSDQALSTTMNPTVFLRRAQYLPLALLGFYITFIGLLTIPEIQREFVSRSPVHYHRAHQMWIELCTSIASLYRSIRISVTHKRTDWLVSRPPRYEADEIMEIAFKTRNFNLTTSDGETIGAWHVLYDVV